MSTTTVVPPTPNNYSAPSTAPDAKLAAPIQRTIVPAGPAYLDYLRLTLSHGGSFEEHDKHLESEKERLLSLNGDGSLNGEDDLGVGDEPETDDILSLDPKEWKQQDHYKVLGLSHLRYKATADQIKIAHRKKVLKHHPDKKVTSQTPETTSSILNGVNLNTNDDAFFKCIQKAHEVLTNSEKRRQYDSVDHELMEIQDDVPTEKDFKKEKLDFFKTFQPIFERESRFSKAQPAVPLGDNDAPKEHVESFYDFWYNFDSWRSFEWLDKEINEGSDSRDDKRYTEKKNKSERARRKKEDTARLRKLVDLALSLDPRIARIKQEEKASRQQKKAAKGGNTAASKKAQEEEEKRAKEAEAKQKEEEEKKAREQAKKDKAAAANAAKKARRQQRAAEATGGDA